MRLAKLAPTVAPAQQRDHTCALAAVDAVEGITGRDHAQYIHNKNKQQCCPNTLELQMLSQYTYVTVLYGTAYLWCAAQYVQEQSPPNTQ